MTKGLLDYVTITKPCMTDWELMMGNERNRYCSQCDKHVHNLSQMTRKQAEALLVQTQGNLCARIERRADGSILTTDKLISLPRLNQKFLRVASATISAVLSLSPTIIAKPTKNLPVLNAAQVKQDKSEPQSQDKNEVVKVHGQVLDPVGAVIANATITATNETTKQTWKTFSSSDGEYKLLLPQGHDYAVSFESPGFKKLMRVGLRTQNTISLLITATMEIGEALLMLGVVALEIPDIATASAAENLHLNAKETSPLPAKPPPKTLANVLLAPIKKITGGKNK